MSIKIGGDPEFFIIDGDSNPVGAFEFFPGTKDNPYGLIGGDVQVDGFAVEIGIEPCETAEDFTDHVYSLLEQCKSFVPSDHKFVFTPVIDFGKEYFSKAPNKAKEIGCSPSWDVYGSRINPVPLLSDSTTRYAGGHIHVGWQENLDLNDPFIIHMLDSMGRTVLSSVDKGFDLVSRDSSAGKVLKRLNDYNCRWSVRHKPYGLEFRRPNNWWLDCDMKKNTHDMFNHIKEKVEKYASASN